MSRLIRLLIPVIVIVLSYAGYRWLSYKEPIPKRERPPRASVLAEGRVLTRENFTITIESQGIARAHNETALTPRVNGRILSVSPLFENGAFFKEGDVLIELDPTDFEAAVASAEARLASAQASLAQEEARAEQALLDWEDLGYTEPPSDLVLRKPQLKQAHAEVKAAESQLTDARNELERTKVRAPYDGRVRSRLVGLGQSVSSGTTLGEIFSTDSAEIRLPLSARQFSRLDLPATEADPPLPVTLTDALLDEEPATWEAQIVRSEGVLDEKSRKLFVIARVEDPFGLRKDGPTMKIGQPVRASIAGKDIENVFVVPRSALRSPTEIIVVNPEDSRLTRRVVMPVWNDEERLIIRDGLEEGWTLVTSKLSTAPNGALVEFTNDPAQVASSSENEEKSDEAVQ
ncbi:MAG: efflux RND transporter periplasmic adaptor subunit [Verrucomicrobiales bacterium]